MKVRVYFNQTFSTIDVKGGGIGGGGEYKFVKVFNDLNEKFRKDIHWDLITWI